jgi:hypothetical protein
MGNRQLLSGPVTGPKTMDHLAAIVRRMRADALTYPVGSPVRAFALMMAHLVEDVGRTLVRDLRARLEAN